MTTPMPLNPWTRPLELAWESFLEGSIPVGSTITDGEGRLVTEGRNRVAGPTGSGLTGSSIAHAEMDALTTLDPGEYSEHTIWSTLEPCFMCTGAIVHSHVGTSRFAAADPLIAGVDRIPELNRWVAARWPERHGPEPGPIGAFCGLLHLVWHLRSKPTGTVVTYQRDTNPTLVAQAEEASRLLRDPPSYWSDAARLLGFAL